MNSEKNFQFEEPVTEIIRRRKSVRTYSGMRLSPDIKKKIFSYFQQLHGLFGVEIRFELLDTLKIKTEAKVKLGTYGMIQGASDIKKKIFSYFQQLHGLFGVEIRFELLDTLKIKTEAKVKLGTYGMIQGASSFIAAAVPKKERYLEELGYVFEYLILHLTSLGLGTCWLAGTFNKSEFSKVMQPGPDEIMPIVTPVGYPGWIRSPHDILIKPIPAIKIRKTWHELFFENKFNNRLEKAAVGDYAAPLEMVRLAPSASNKQPWRIVRKDGCFYFYLAHDPVYSYRYPYDLQKVDMGIAMCHFECAAQEAGLKGKWETQSPVIENVPGEMEYIITWVTV